LPDGESGIFFTKGLDTKIGGQPVGQIGPASLLWQLLYPPLEGEITRAMDFMVTEPVIGRAFRATVGSR
jgi:hypothetical protein